MIIIKIMILHFIQITHTDDFPSTGIRLVHNVVSNNLLTIHISRYMRMIYFLMILHFVRLAFVPRRYIGFLKRCIYVFISDICSKISFVVSAPVAVYLLDRQRFYRDKNVTLGS